MVEYDIDPVTEAFAFMNKPREQYVGYWRENQTGERITLVALMDGRVVGYTNVLWQSGYPPFFSAGIPEINDMNVAGELRGRGIGRAMVAAAEAEARAAGKRIMGIGVGLTPDYSIAQHLYPLLGYQYDGRGVEMDPWGGAMFLTKRI